jgi:hypothetical protein
MAVMRTILPALLLLTGCGASPDWVATAAVAPQVASIAIIHRSPFDAIFSLLSGKDCSVVRLDRGEAYCRPVESEPPAQPLCTRSLGVVDCWDDPSAVAGHPKGVANGPDTLTPAQEANRARTWP